MKLLVLYEELAGYTIACLKYLVEQHGIEVHVFRKKINKEAPFDFDFGALKIYNREQYTSTELLEVCIKIDAQVLFCSGWMHKPYLQVAKEYRKKKRKTVLLFDNHWTGSFKQQLSRLYSAVMLKPKFTDCFVAGDAQKQFALKLGFKSQEVQTGFYCCDVQYFKNIYNQTFENKKQNYPKVLLFVGRYVKHKGIDALCDSFIKLSDRYSDWSLHCVGTGPEKPIKHQKIKHFGFLQPSEMQQVIGHAGVFVLPSYFEPWGVVVQEFALSGMPLVLSDQIGAGERFLTTQNGLKFKVEQVDSLTNTLEQIMQKEPSELIEMGQYSHHIAAQHNLLSWANTVLNYFK